ncbi:MAG: hypothetical protein KAJ19_17525, partial [Gammaproteobacteria bacterium]|nr:hypothetical protein [Gammaproteobacteria bacterium]
MKKWNRNKILLILVGLISLMVVNVTSVAAHAVSTYSDDTYTTLKGDFLRGETVYGKGTSWAQEDMMQLRYFEQASTNVISHYCTTVTDTNVVYCEWTIPLWEPFTNHLLKLAVRDEGEDYWVFNDAVTTFWVMRCRSDSVCDDGIWCNGAETCVDYTCQDGARPEDDNVSCTDYICNETTHVVTHVANNGNCDDNLFCNGIEICDATNDCIIQAGTLPDCNDDMNCTVDSCIEGQDNYTCTNTPSNARCDDSLWCNGAETCDANLGCQAGTPPGTADNLDCTDDWCDEVDDMIVHTENHLFCDDGLWCNGGESCSISLGGCQAGYTKTCNDGVGCTDDSCNETTDSCDNLVNDGNCDNGLWCDGAETCDATDDCQAGTAPTPNIEDDGINCTDVVCDETTHNFTNVMNNANCDDGLFCNGVETCDIELDCLAGTAPDCGDPIFCTDDSCDEENNTCINIPNDAYCDDGNFCNGAEKCDITFDCDESGYGIPLVLDDGISWTIDSCDEVLNLVLHTPNHALCDDGIFCNGAETMGPDGSCQAGTAPDCDDAVGCTDDSCNETTDSCDNSP